MCGPFKSWGEKNDIKNYVDICFIRSFKRTVKRLDACEQINAVNKFCVNKEV